MITGFHFRNRDKNEKGEIEEHLWWEPIRYLPSYYWMFHNEECTHTNCTYCNDTTAPGCCLIFTYAQR